MIAGPLFGEVWHCVFLIVNMILFINLVIAILSNTFSILHERRLALYYNGVIEAMP